MNNIDHLGGFSTDQIGDSATYYPTMWKYVIDDLQIKSVLDIGCGMGISTKFFKDNGCSVRGIEGHPYPLQNSLVKEDITHHDYTTGVSNLKGTFDLGWSCEFVEHVREEYSDYFLQDFAKCKYILMTYATPGQGGHHHVNCQPKEYWIDRLKSYGFNRDVEKEIEYQKIAIKDSSLYSPSYTGHFVSKGLFFRKNA